VVFVGRAAAGNRLFRLHAVRHPQAEAAFGDPERLHQQHDARVQDAHCHHCHFVGRAQAPNIAQSPGRLLNYASIISQEADRLQKGVERVLQMAVLEKDEIKLKKETVHLHDLLTTVAEPFGVLLAGGKAR
jgi:signal transduction histidine kinase